MGLRLRLLPLTIFVLALMVTVKAGELWRGLEPGWRGFRVAEVRAQQTPGERPTKISESAEEAEEGDADQTEGAAAGLEPVGEGDETLIEDGNEALIADDGEALAEDSGEALAEDSGEALLGDAVQALLQDKDNALDGNGGEPLLDGESTASDEDLLQGSSGLTQSELEVLNSLRERRSELETRAARLDLRENMVRAAEHALESKIQDWKQLKVEVEVLLEKYDSEREDDLKTLATYYEKMKAKDAARVFNTLDMPYLIDIVERMKEAKVADIIGRMDTARAKSLTVELAKKGRLPKPDDQLAAQD